MKNNILNMKVGSHKIKAIVKEVYSIDVLRHNDDVNQVIQPKIVLKVTDLSTNVEYKVSDTWITTAKDGLVVRALWFYEAIDGIYANSTLAKAMKFYNIEVLKDFIGKTVELFPDKNGFQTLITTQDHINI